MDPIPSKTRYRYVLGSEGGKSLGFLFRWHDIYLPLHTLHRKRVSLNYRICPGKALISDLLTCADSASGMHLADATLFITCARVLARFTITKAVENGQVLTPEPEYTSGTIRCDIRCMRASHAKRLLCSHPKPFKCKIESRSANIM